jgi:hypothetical protein
MNKRQRFPKTFVRASLRLSQGRSKADTTSWSTLIAHLSESVGCADGFAAGGLTMWDWCRRLAGFGSFRTDACIRSPHANGFKTGPVEKRKHSVTDDLACQGSVSSLSVADDRVRDLKVRNSGKPPSFAGIPAPIRACFLEPRSRSRPGGVAGVQAEHVWSVSTLRFWRLFSDFDRSLLLCRAPQMICPVEIAHEMSALRAARMREHVKHGLLPEGRDGAGDESTGRDVAGDGQENYLVAGRGDTGRQRPVCLAKSSCTHKMNDLAQGSIRTFPIRFLP